MFFLTAYQHPNGSYESIKNGIKRDWNTSSWSPWQNAWESQKGHHANHHLPLTLQQNSYEAISKSPLRANNSYEKNNRNDGTYNHSFVSHDEQKYTSSSTSTGGIQASDILSPTRHAIRSNGFALNTSQAQHYPVQPAYIPDQVPISTQFLEGRGRVYSDSNSSMPFQSQQSTAYSSNPQTLVSFLHPTSSSHLHEDIRRISPQSAYTYTGVSSNLSEHLQIHPNYNQRTQPMQDMDMLQDLLSTGAHNHYNGSSTFSR